MKTLLKWHPGRVPRRSAPILLIATLAAFQAAGAQETGSVFEFETKLSEDAYRKSVATMPRDRIDPIRVAASNFPAFSTWIDSVEPGSAAEKAGLGSNWRIVAFNDREIWTHFQRLIDHGKPRILDVVSPEGIAKTLTFEPEGRIGIISSNTSRPERAVLESIPRGEWDDDMMVAAVAWDTGDWDLAETALRKAMDDGLGSVPVIRLYGALTALDRRDLALSRRLMNSLLEKLSAEEPIPRLYQRGLLSLALAHGDYGLAMRVTADHEGMSRPIQPQTLRDWGLWADGKPREPLLKRALAAAGPDLLARCEKVIERWQSPQHVMEFDPARDGTFVREVAPGRFHRLSFAPPGAVQNMIWSLRFGFRDTGATEHTNRLQVCLIDRKGQSEASKRTRDLPGGRAVASISRIRRRDGEVHQDLQAGPGSGHTETRFHFRSMNERELARYARHVEAGLPGNGFESPNINELTLLRVEDESAIVLNGVTILHAPVDPKVEDVFCILQMEGISIVIEKMVLRETTP